METRRLEYQIYVVAIVGFLRKMFNRRVLSIYKFRCYCGLHVRLPVCAHHSTFIAHTSLSGLAYVFLPECILPSEPEFRFLHATAARPVTIYEMILCCDFFQT